MLIKLFFFPTFSKYSVICGDSQRQEYKNDFNIEYLEYQKLYQEISKVSQKFLDWDSQMKKLSKGSPSYEVIFLFLFKYLQYLFLAIRGHMQDTNFVCVNSWLGLGLVCNLCMMQFVILKFRSWKVTWCIIIYRVYS